MKGSLKWFLSLGNVFIISICLIAIVNALLYNMALWSTSLHLLGLPAIKMIPKMIVITLNSHPGSIISFIRILFVFAVYLFLRFFRIIDPQPHEVLIVLTLFQAPPLYWGRGPG